ncbi:hypothetical protein [Streptomyces humi]
MGLHGNEGAGRRGGGRPADLTGPVLFLASDAAAFVTGQLYVDGGRTLVEPPTTMTLEAV